MKFKKFTFVALLSMVTICASGCDKLGDLVKLTVTKLPNKTTYQVGETFDTTGMVVTGTFYNPETDETAEDEYDDYYYWAGDNEGKLRLNDTYVKITDTNNYNSAIYTTVQIKVTKEAVDPTPHPDTGTYYSSISESLTGNSLLSALQSLNSKKRTRTVGYKTMLNNPEKGFYITDPGDGKETITTFYSGRNNTGKSGLNREHVWPKSHGGNLVEGDIHMPRPTLNAENGSRGNSFYVEGKKSTTSGWDPAMEDFGQESYRGDSARIIFYCCVASNQLELIDAEEGGSRQMGKLSDLLKWNLKYPVLPREQTRNAGAESLQGNRNPFIDHPEYACRIWGMTNSTTRAICGM